MESNLCFISKPLNYFRIDGNTVRSKHYNTIGYLNEILDLILIICSNTEVAFKVKSKAMKLWTVRAIITTRDNQALLKELSVKGALDIFRKIIRIYFN
jgi:hypothetical protein